MGTILRMATIATALLLAGSVAAAGQGSPRAHDGGFMIRMALGFGAGTGTIDRTDSTPKLEVDGPAGDVEIAIGGVIRDNLALHGTIFGFSLSDPDAKRDGIDGTYSGSYTMSGIGGGITWWLMPLNFYLSGTAGLAVVSAEPDDGPSGSTDTGFAMQISVGKEWWVSESWGLGIAGGFTYYSVPEKDIDENWTGTAFAIRFSATYN